MRIFNPDGSEPQMCGNGARCAALYLGKNKASIETKAGIIKTQVKGENVKIKLTEPKNIKLDIPIRVNNRNLKVNFIDTGVPHTVIFVEGLDKIDVFNLGRDIRYHKQFAPRGANVNFIEVAGKNAIAIRTYERGVEDETLACGTGSVAAALIFALKANSGNKICVRTKSGEILTVYFKRVANKFSDVWLEGKARIVFKGEFVN
jgi:diaminopimelate epimerase